MNRFKKIVKILFGVPLTCIAFFFIGKIFFDSWSQIQPHFLHANIWLLGFGVLCMLGFFALRSFSWIKILQFFAKSDKSITGTIYHYSLAETKRYIPGNIFSFISRIQKFEGKTYSKKTILHAILLETIIVIIASGIVSSIGIFHVFVREDLKVPFFASVLLILLSASFFLLKKKPKIFRKLVRLFPNKKIFEYIDVVFLSVCGWILFGIGNYFFASALFPNDLNKIILFSSLFTLSWLIGYLSFIFPMGLGVREAVAIYLFTPFFPLYAATAISLFTRIMFVGSELVFLMLAWMLRKVPGRIKRVLLRPISLIVLFNIFYISYFSYFTILRHMNFMSGKFDLGNMEHTVWNTLHGNIFIFSNPDGVGELSRLSAHADFILILLTPFYALYQNAATLLIIQTVIISLGGIFLYLLAKRIVGFVRIAVIVSLGYYLNFFVQEQTIFDFHSVSLATTFLLGAFYFLIEKKYKWFALLLLLAVLTKENVYLVSALFGGFLILKGKRFAGAFLCISSVAVFLYLMSVAIPHARQGQHFAMEYLAYLGGSPMEILLSPILKPAVFFGRLLSIETFKYIYTVFLPVGFLSFFAPLYTVFLLPDFFINIFSNNPNLRSIQYHYGALLVPFMYISSLYGMKKIISIRIDRKLATNFIFYYLLIFIVYSSFLFSPLPGTRNADIAPFKYNEDRQDIFRMLRMIPQNASVSATNNIAAHLVHREKIYVLPQGVDVVDYLVFYRDRLDFAEETQKFNKQFMTLVETNDFLILKRINPGDVAYK